MKQTIITILLALVAVTGYGQTDSTKTKKRELSVYATVADHLTHEGIDSLKATLLRAADSSFIDTIHVESYKYDDKRQTYAVAKITEAGSTSPPKATSTISVPPASGRTSRESMSLTSTTVSPDRLSCRGTSNLPPT